jgi:hypothetical protein
MTHSLCFLSRGQAASIVIPEDNNTANAAITILGRWMGGE